MCMIVCQWLSAYQPTEYKYTLAFMGYGDDEQSQCVFELTYNYGRTDYTKGDGYGQVAISTTDVYKTAEQIRAAGGTITREPGPVPGIGCDAGGAPPSVSLMCCCAQDQDCGDHRSRRVEGCLCGQRGLSQRARVDVVESRGIICKHKNIGVSMAHVPSQM